MTIKYMTCVLGSLATFGYMFFCLSQCTILEAREETKRANMSNAATMMLYERGCAETQQFNGRVWCLRWREQRVGVLPT